MARSIFRSQNVQNTRGSDHFWRFRCGKSVEKVHAVVARSTFRSQKCKKLRVLTWKCASRHNGVHFFDIATSKSGPRMVRVFQKWSDILTSKCASRHNGVHFFDISTSKSGPIMVCFVHFDFEMCFAPQRRALFGHLNFQKWFDAGVLCTF